MRNLQFRCGPFFIHWPFFIVSSILLQLQFFLGHFNFIVTIRLVFTFQICRSPIFFIGRRAADSFIARVSIQLASLSCNSTSRILPRYKYIPRSARRSIHPCSSLHCHHQRSHSNHESNSFYNLMTSAIATDNSTASRPGRMSKTAPPWPAPHLPDHRMWGLDQPALPKTCSHSWRRQPAVQLLSFFQLELSLRWCWH